MKRQAQDVLERVRSSGVRSRIAAGMLAATIIVVAGVATRYGDERPPLDPAGALPAAETAGQAGAADADLAGEAAREASAREGSAAEAPGDGAARDPAAGDGAAGAGGAAAADAAAGAAGPAGAGDRVVWAAPTDPSPVTPVPASARVPKPEAVRGIYVGGWSAGSQARLERLIRLADETEVNAFVIDVKDVTGEVTYRTGVPLAKQVGADRNIKIGDIRGLLARLREHGIYPIARIVAFKDPLLAEARPEWAIRRADGSVWKDNKGVAWVDSFNEHVWEYNIELAREAIALGFSEVQWDYVRFPDAPGSYMREAVYAARNGRTMADGIRQFMIRSKERLADLDVPVTADVFGVTTSASGDVGIGQVWEKMADVMDVLLPMVYPSHYPRGTWGYALPNAAPYQIVKKAMDHGVARSREIENAATIRPWLQAFSMGPPAYGPEHVRAQIDAVYDAGLTEWILWDPAVRYSREAFATADGREPWFAGRGASLYRPEARPERERERRRGGGPLGTAVQNVQPEGGHR